MGSFPHGSDIDLALECKKLDQAQLSRIYSDLEKSQLPYKVGLLLARSSISAPLLEHIHKVGQLFYERE